MLVNETTYKGKDGSTIFFMPQNYVFLATRTMIGSMQYAGVGQKNEDDTALQIYEGERIPHIWFPDNSDVRKCRLSARPCPVPPPVENWMIMKVD